MPNKAKQFQPSLPRTFQPFIGKSVQLSSARTPRSSHWSRVFCSPGRGRFPEPPQTRRLLSSHLLLCEKFERKCKATKRLASTRAAGSAWFAFIAGLLTVADLGAPLRSLAPGPASRHGFGLCPGDADRPAGSDLDMSCCLCLPAARPARKQ